MSFVFYVNKFSRHSSIVSLYEATTPIRQTYVMISIRLQKITVSFSCPYVMTLATEKDIGGTSFFDFEPHWILLLAFDLVVLDHRSFLFV